MKKTQHQQALEAISKILERAKNDPQPDDIKQAARFAEGALDGTIKFIDEEEFKKLSKEVGLKETSISKPFKKTILDVEPLCCTKCHETFDDDSKGEWVGTEIFICDNCAG
jgi:hypothetical protein